ncbi:hypothetical protein QGM71_00370 [Virgibacillus sp. C22-A2]|uniref:Sporulation membrane protein YtrI C-terminal domain-containing protein n=1 Tax=Virgibacillus tibetensis TaxID=3042313 RepID=A0ABU6KA76_9BACI|nr:hypothetical protein [Virgibacillus sp. C22-A2]
MHIPPYHKKETWQRFYAGALIGGIIAYFILIYMYGSMYEKQLEENRELQANVIDLKNQNKALLQDKEDMDEESKKPLLVESIEITITNTQELRLDRLIVHDLEEMLKKEINHIIGQDISIIGNSDTLLISTIENKAFSIDDLTYYFRVKLLTISQTVKITAEAKLGN